MFWNFSEFKNTGNHNAEQMLNYLLLADKLDYVVNIVYWNVRSEFLREFRKFARWLVRKAMNMQKTKEELIRTVKAIIGEVHFETWNAEEFHVVRFTIPSLGFIVTAIDKKFKNSIVEKCEPTRFLEQIRKMWLRITQGEHL